MTKDDLQKIETEFFDSIKGSDPLTPEQIQAIYDRSVKAVMVRKVYGEDEPKSGPHVLYG